MQDQTIVILGSSGAGISLALAAARAGLGVTVIEPDAGTLERVQVFADRDDPDVAARVSFTVSTDAPTDTAFVFDALESGADPAPFQVPDPAIFATPFSGVTGHVVAHPAARVRFVPFQPMQFRALTEITGFPETSGETLDCATTLARRIGRKPVVLPKGYPSVGLRLSDRLEQVADQLLLEGAVLWELDEAMVAFGFDLGLYEAQDLTGLDVAYARRRAQRRTSLIADRAVAEGRIGKKVGWGWYRYPGGGGAVIDPLIEDLIREEAWFAKVTQRSFSAAEMMERLMMALVQEARLILSEGHLIHARDVNTIACHGLGFPQEHGGLIAHAARIGRPLPP
ncbi:3-hydroxyacyl-CoA dehydrogenase family protein [Aestuariivita sp.]|jgi:3-hydroxyacyl-CoA dehydrogenase|uniref:3-hydroxyacyl-CoA dehydrogenase family protein n=1 Tax=Aestuariivita sp. TaxID=1872407 RepID=UPI00216C7282|nr:3-hydroxyacyl-CoA dehydrogenase family protein [Aestuariivita sp.]MCE8005416.1 hypothetical protein [Aestuariivita sp.]